MFLFCYFLCNIKNIKEIIEIIFQTFKRNINHRYFFSLFQIFPASKCFYLVLIFSPISVSLFLSSLLLKKGDSIKRELQISMFSIPDIREGNLARCTRDLLRSNIEIIRVFPDPWRANLSLYKNVVVARIILYKNTYSTLSLTVTNNQITSVCTDFDTKCGDGGIWK